jgi:hypothetical protein
VLEQLGAHCRHGDQLPGSRKKGVTVCGVPRSWVAAGLGLLGALLLQRSRALLTFAWSLLLGKHSCAGIHPGVSAPGQFSYILFMCCSMVSEHARWSSCSCRGVPGGASCDIPQPEP